MRGVTSKQARRSSHARWFSPTPTHSLRKLTTECRWSFSRINLSPWLTGKGGLEMLQPAANDVLQKWPVSRRVNSFQANNDDATLIDPLPSCPTAALSGVFAS
jgi:hypothetical protein